MRGSVWAATVLSTALWLSLSSAARCGEAEPADIPITPAAPPESESGPQPEAEPQPRSQPPPEPELEGAIALMVNYAPDYQGSSAHVAKFTPGIYVRYGRYSISTISGFVTRKETEVIRGLAADLLNTERMRVNLGLRLDRGRDTSDNPALTGLEDVQTTIRGRLLVNRALGRGWTVSLGASADLLGRGGGVLLDASTGRSYNIAGRITWSWGVSVSAGNKRYMQTYFGITEAQAAATGYPVYTPGAGLRDMSVGTDLRSDLGDRWVGYLGASASRVLSPARNSPLNRTDSGWSVRVGLAWRF
jgi:MipA family protein